MRLHGHANVLCHPMFGILALTVDQLLRLTLQVQHRQEALALIVTPSVEIDSQLRHEPHGINSVLAVALRLGVLQEPLVANE